MTLDNVSTFSFVVQTPPPVLYSSARFPSSHHIGNLDIFLLLRLVVEITEAMAANGLTDVTVL
jgi:hypothetical protein